MSCIKPIVLAIDTSSKLTSLAVARGDRIVAVFGAEVDGRRSERLWNEIQFLLGEVELTINDVDLFSVCVGPGGFTGIRVGIAAAKGFALAASKPLIGITSLEALACSAYPARYAWTAVTAYKGEVFVQLFELNPNQLPSPLTEPQLVSIEAARRLIATEPNATLVAGSSICDSEEKWPCEVSPAPRFIGEQVARLGGLRFASGERTEAGLLRACYLRPPDAEIKLSQRSAIERGDNA